MQFYFHQHCSLSLFSVCECLHGNDALAAVAQAVVLIHSLNVLIYCENESENERLRERERIIMFPLLSRLPQLSPKRGSQSTCLLIHLKLSNNRTPQFVSISLFLFLSRPQSLFLAPPVFTLFHMKLLFIAQDPQYVFFFSFPFCVCTNLSALPPHAFRLQLCLTSQLYVGLAESPHPPSLSPLPLSLFRASLQGTGRGKPKRLNILDCTPPEEKQRFDFPCVVSDRIVLFVWPVCVFFTSATLNPDK